MKSVKILVLGGSIGQLRLVNKSMEFKKLLNTISVKTARLVVVSKNGIGTPVQKFLKKYKKKKMSVKNLKNLHFKVDVRRHILSPVHTLCTPEEVAKIMRSNKIVSLAGFPKVKSSDAQILWIGGEPGQLVKLVRKGTTGEGVYYRLIIR